MYCLDRSPGDRLYLGTGSSCCAATTPADSWEVVGRGLDGVTIYGVAALRHGTLIAATSSGVYRSVDAALNWSPVHWNRDRCRRRRGRRLAIRPPIGGRDLVGEPLVGEPERQHERRRGGDEREHEDCDRAARHGIAHGLLELIGQGIDPARRLEQRADRLVAPSAPAARRRDAVVAVNSPPATATPIVDPILRVNCVVDVAAPRRSSPTAFCTATMWAGVVSPMPSPTRATQIDGTNSGVPAVIRHISPVPTASSSAPTIAVGR